MGEISKKRGEFGERVTAEFLKTIGWTEFLTGREIECYRPQDHIISKKERKDHGVDFVYQYDCPLYSDNQIFVLISSKINDKYPSNPVSKFKLHLRDIAYTIDCFKKSSLRSKLKNNEFNIKIKNAGVIFWIDNSNQYDDVIDRLSDLRIDEDLSFESIYLVDNKRADFIFDAIDFARNAFPKSIVEFLHPATGYNSTAGQRIGSSSILPIQYINSSILPLKIIEAENEYLVLNCIDDLEEDYLNKLINLSQKLTETWSTKIFILFPEYNHDLYSEIVEDVKLRYRDQRFTSKIKVSSFRKNFKNIEL